MIYFPETRIQWAMGFLIGIHYIHYVTHLYNAQQHSLCAWLLLEVVAELSSVSSVILLCLPSSTVQSQLLLAIPLWGTGAPYPQSGIPFPRIRACSLPMVQNTFLLESLHYLEVSTLNVIAITLRYVFALSYNALTLWRNVIASIS
jgi:hypothetical protein